MKRIIFILLLLSILGCNNTKDMGVKEKSRETGVKMDFLTTEDNVKIAYKYYDAGSNKGAILLHMLSKDKSTWHDFAEELKNHGYSTIAIDLRGHGQSDLDFRKFDERQFNNMLLDTKAAFDFLKRKNISSVALIGASIGANAALNFAENNDVATAVLLSPGLDYRGIKTEQAMKNINKPVLIVVSKEDKYSFDSSNRLKELSSNSEMKVYKDRGHGTTMLGNDLNKLILDWLNDHL